MCIRCTEINESIARYQRLTKQITDQQMQEAALRLMAALEAEKLVLHPKE